MDDVSLVLYLCLSVPLLLSSGLLEKRSRLMVIFIVLGATICLLSAQINGVILLFADNIFDVTTNLTPVTEEIGKALPILFYAWVVSDRRETLISAAMAEGIGFAILENSVIFVSSGSQSDVLWAVSRVFGASLMHGICTAAVGIGISFIHKKRKLFIPGTFALLSAAMIYHGIFNALVQSPCAATAFLLPLLTYILLFLTSRKRRSLK